MSDHPAPGSTLALEALLFCSHVLPEDDRAAFEARLASDQQVREAVALAAELVQTCSPEPVLVPDSTYRIRLKECFLPRPRFWKCTLRPLRPAAWSLLGASAASVLFLVLTPPQSTPSVPAPTIAAPAEVASSTVPQTDLEEARVWEELPRGQHLLKAHEDERRRRNRHDLSLRLVKRDDASDVSASHH